MNNKTETPEEKEAFDVMAQDNEMAEVKAKPESGQEIFISQINTNAGIEDNRWYHTQFWCDSGHQNQLLELGLVFTDRVKAELHTKRLVGLTEQPKPKRTKEEYVTVEDVKSGERLWYLDEGEYHNCLVIGWHPEQPLVVVESDESIGCVMMQSIYRKVETETTEREAFIETACKAVRTSAEEDIKIIGAMFGSGKFKLVENK